MEGLYRMSVFELLAQAGVLGGDALKKALEWVIDNVPDQADAARQALAALATALNPVALASLAQTVVKELGDVGAGKLDGRSHPSDLG